MALAALQLQSARRIVTLALGLLLVPHLWFVRSDFTLYADDWPNLRERLMVRGVMVALSLIGIVLVRQTTTRETYERVVFGVALTLALAVVGLNGLRPQGSVLPLRTPLMILIVLYGAFPNTFWRQVTPPLLLSAGLGVLRLTWVTSGAQGDIGGDLVVLAVINAIGIATVLRRRGLEQDLNVAWQAEHDSRLATERALAELRTLRGIIPICSHCKKVRSAIGDWEQIEQYVREHSEAEFSHGICPTCFETHYGDLDLPPAVATPP